MTRRPGWLNQHDDRITVAVERDVDDLLRVARRLTFVPELISRSRPEPRLFSFESSREALAIHVSEREHFASRGILHDGRHQPALVKANVVNVDHLTSKPRLLR